MNKNILVYSVIGLVVGSVATFLLLSTTSIPNVNAMMGMMGRNWNREASTQRNGSSMMAGNVDRHFIEQMIPHHEDAITMAELAVTKAQRPEIRTLADNIIKAQTDENNQMTQWYQQWYGQSVPQGDDQMGMHGMMGGNGMHMGMMGDDTDIESLTASTDFDKEFIQQMIPHHQMAIMMASMLENSTENPEMKQLAQNIIQAQTQEIQQMRAWYREWYQ